MSATHQDDQHPNGRQTSDLGFVGQTVKRVEDVETAVRLIGDNS